MSITFAPKASMTCLSTMLLYLLRPGADLIVPLELALEHLGRVRAKLRRDRRLFGDDADRIFSRSPCNHANTSRD
jgi:hypothetical protein